MDIAQFYGHTEIDAGTILLHCQLYIISVSSSISLSTSEQALYCWEFCWRIIQKFELQSLYASFPIFHIAKRTDLKVNKMIT